MRIFAGFAPLRDSEVDTAGSRQAAKTQRTAKEDTTLPLVGELHVHLMRNDAALVAFGEQAEDGLTAAFAVIES